MSKPTLTVHEACEFFRANQIPVSEALFGQMVCEGKFPFAVGTRGDGRGTFIIFKNRLYAWLDEMLGHEAAGKE